MSYLIQLLPLLFSFTVVGALYVLFMKKPPEWVNEMKIKWKTVMLFSVLAGVVGSIIVSLIFDLYSEIHLLPMTAITVSTSVVSFAFVQSLFTDFSLHLVDRRMLYASMITPLILHLSTLLYFNDTEHLGPWIIAIMIAGALIFLPGIMGPSDGRAMLLASIAVFPIIGYRLFFYGLVSFILLAFGFILLKSALYAFKGKDFKSFFKYLKMKKHHPMVPFILFPFLVIIPLTAI